MSDQQSPFPPCGLYKTGLALHSDENAVPAGVLVSFHNHSDQGQPFIQLPENNTHNIWSFQKSGPGVGDDMEFMDQLIPLLPQGVYVIKEPVQTNVAAIPAGAIMQLGYNRSADVILFPGSWENGTIIFPEKGIKFPDQSIFDNLLPVGLANNAAPHDQGEAH